jgi:diacylglycerol kinase (ATP)
VTTTSAKQRLAAFCYRRFIGASRYSWLGLRACFHNEEAFRFELFVGVLLLPLAFLIAESTLDFCLLLSSMLLVLISELLNSALEAAVDLFETEYNELAGRVKDQGSAAVLLSMVLFLMVWGLLGWQKIVG